MGDLPIERAFKILDVINNRLSASKAELVKVCGVSTRSIYRYIDRLSEAGIPIYKDKETGRYRMLRAPQFVSNSLNATDAIVLRLALNLLISRLNNDYPHATKAVKSLLDRVSAPQSSESLTFQSAGYRQLESENSNITEILNCAILFEASLSQKKVRVDLRQPNGKTKEVVIRRPALKCSDRWQVFDLRNSQAEPIQVERIQEVRIL